MVCIEKRPHILYGRSSAPHFRYLTCLLDRGHIKQYVDMISPARLVSENSVPTLMGYGLKDHLVPGKLKYKLVSALEENGVQYDYFEFPHCNHGMYRDLNILEQFLKQSLVYCKTYF